jgi:hypothetical protein
MPIKATGHVPIALGILVCCSAVAAIFLWELSVVDARPEDASLLASIAWAVGAVMGALLGIGIGWWARGAAVGVDHPSAEGTDHSDSGDPSLGPDGKELQ